MKTLVQPLLPLADDPARPVLDDQAALKTSGAADAVHVLRGLFAGELRQLVNELDLLVEQPTELADRLHRLLASCGFCGAHALADASRRLKRHLDSSARPPDPAEVEHFRQALACTLQALERQATSLS